MVTPNRGSCAIPYTIKWASEADRTLAHFFDCRLFSGRSAHEEFQRYVEKVLAEAMADIREGREASYRRLYVPGTCAYVIEASYLRLGVDRCEVVMEMISFPGVPPSINVVSLNLERRALLAVVHELWRRAA